MTEVRVVIPMSPYAMSHAKLCRINVEIIMLINIIPPLRNSLLLQMEILHQLVVDPKCQLPLYGLAPESIPLNVSVFSAKSASKLEDREGFAFDI